MIAAFAAEARSGGVNRAASAALNLCRGLWLRLLMLLLMKIALRRLAVVQMPAHLQTATAAEFRSRRKLSAAFRAIKIWRLLLRLCRRLSGVDCKALRRGRLILSLLPALFKILAVLPKIMLTLPEIMLTVLS